MPNEQLTDERIEEIYHEQWYAHPGEVRRAAPKIHQMVLRFARAIESELRAHPAAQPVAWRTRSTDPLGPLPWRFVDAEHYVPRPDIYEEQPLYAAPQPAHEGAECWLAKNSFGDCATGHLPKLSELPSPKTGEGSAIEGASRVRVLNNNEKLRDEFWNLIHEWADGGTEERIEWVEQRIEELIVLRTSAIEGGDSTEEGGHGQS